MSASAVIEPGRRNAEQHTAQKAWAAVSIADRLRVIGRFRQLAADRARLFARSVAREDLATTLSAEVLPLLEACRFLERNAGHILRTTRIGRRGRPIWLNGVDVEIRREPFGVVLVIAPANYPLLLPAVHAVQALTAGNAVLLKPGRGGADAMELFRTALLEAGLHPALLLLTDESPKAGEEAVNSDVDKIVLTGSGQTGTAVLRNLDGRTVPTIMELSGDDAVFVRPGADLDLVVRAVEFGLRLNDGNTCIVPRRVYAPPEMAAHLHSRIPIPVIPAGDEQAVRHSEESGYGLGASVFGEPQEAAAFARRLNVGVVVINDIIVPTADPRVPFGGRGRSGYGVTRGAEGLLELTQPKAIVTRNSRFLPHLDGLSPADADLFAAFIEFTHGSSWQLRWRALRNVVGAAMRRRK